AQLEKEIHDRQQAEQALHESERNYWEIFNSTSDALIVHDADGRILDVNERMCRMFACDRATVLKLTVNDFSLGVPPYSQAKAVELVRRTITNGPQLFEWRARRQTGELFWSEVALHATEIAGHLRVLASVRDISERKELEEALRQSHKMEAIGQLAGGVAHDFNNLLNVINGFADRALGTLEASAPAHGDIQQVRKAGERGTVLIRQLLAFSRKQLQEPKILELDGALTELTPMLRRLIPENIELKIALGNRQDCIRLDPGQIEQVIVNLVINACDAMLTGGKLTIETGRAPASVNEALTGNYLLLAVRDNGIGMTSEVQAHLFEPFFTTKPVGKGSGLGLATCYGIVRQNDGYITAESAVGHGSVFRIYLPRIEAPPEALKHESAPIQPRHGTETILVVEDEPALLELAEVNLSDLGYTVLAASDGETALQLARQHAAQIRLVVSDVIMPKMSGKELATRLRQEHPGLKILFVSGYTADIIDRDGALDSATAFLPKPYTVTDLAAKINELLAGRC
ncbi:MAG: ATP-binding protein, partial [Verrucomicrobiota bacterium]